MTLMPRDDVDAELDVDALKKKLFICYDTKLWSGTTMYRFCKANVAICFSFKDF